jgi:hypothetical protein
MKLLTSNYYSVLFYNSETYLTSITNQNTKIILSASAKALRVGFHRWDRNISFDNLDSATPTRIGEYKIALQLYKAFNLPLP